MAISRLRDQRASPHSSTGRPARVLSEENSAEIPKEVMDSFERLAKIAADNNVSFVDLCVYAIGDINDGKKREIATLPPEQISQCAQRWRSPRSRSYCGTEGTVDRAEKETGGRQSECRTDARGCSKYSDIAIEMAGLIPQLCYL